MPRKRGPILSLLVRQIHQFPRHKLCGAHRRGFQAFTAAHAIRHHFPTARSHCTLSTTTSPTTTLNPSFKHVTNLSSTSHQQHFRQTRTMATHTSKHKVCVIGSGNWGTTIAKVVAENTAEHTSLFTPEVQMWVYEEEYQIPQSSKHYHSSSDLAKSPQKLTHLINTLHENVKYLPDITLPKNIVANPSIEDAAKDASILIFNLPHQFIGRICDMLKGKVLPYARGISCIKGVAVSEEGCELFADTIGRKLGIYCGALSGANIANEVALEKWCETTVAYDPPAADTGVENSTPQKTKEEPNGEPTRSSSISQATNQEPQKAPSLAPLPSSLPPLTHLTIKSLFHRSYFHVRLVHDVAGVSLGGALKNIVALAAGFVDGLGWGDNAKAAVMRVGILEEVKFGTTFFSGSCEEKTFTQESCGVADMITSCSGGRNFRCARMSVREGVGIGEIEERELNGQKLQGTSTAYEVNEFLKAQGLEREFPLFTAVYRILEGEKKPQDIPELIEVTEEAGANVG